MCEFAIGFTSVDTGSEALFITSMNLGDYREETLYRILDTIGSWDRSGPQEEFIPDTKGSLPGLDGTSITVTFSRPFF